MFSRRLVQNRATRVATPVARRTLMGARAVAPVAVRNNNAWMAGLAVGAGMMAMWALQDKEEAEAAGVPVYGVPGTDKERTFIAVREVPTLQLIE